MDTARRLYVYAVAALGLMVFANGVTTLLAEVLDGVGASRTVLLGDGDRGWLSRSIALVVVGAPVWLLHWRLAQRSVTGEDEQARAERGSAIRALYLSVVEVVTIAVALAAALPVAHWALAQWLGLSSRRAPLPVETLAPLVVAGLLWAYHARVQAASLRRGGLRGAAAWLPRLYRYGLALTTLGLALLGASLATGTVLSVAIGRDSLGSPDWWRWALADALALVAIGGLGWLVAWRDADAVTADADIVGEDERPTHLRATYFGGVLLMAAVVGCTALTASTTALARVALGVSPHVDLAAVLEGVLGPVVSAAVFVVAAWLHQRRRVRELLPVGLPQVAAARRLAALLCALVGLSFLAGGLTSILALLLEAIVGWSPRLAGSRDEAVAVAIGLLAAGLATWLPAWSAVLRARASDPVGEARATASSGYLCLVTGTAVVILVPAATYVLYRVLEVLLGGVPERPLPAELAWPLAVIAVSGAVAAAHGHLLLADRRRVASAPQPDRQPEPPSFVTPRPAGDHGPVAVTLTLRLANGTDLSEAIERLRGALGAGASLDLVAPSSAPAPRAPVARRPTPSSSGLVEPDALEDPFEEVAVW